MFGLSKAQKTRFIINLYAPYIGAGVKVDFISDDFREIKVSMKLTKLNRNYVGTHFGSSLYSMVDPFYMLQLMNILGKDYIVWDKSADIDFIAPGKSKVTTEFHISDELIQDIKDKTASGDKYLPSLPVNIMSEEGELIAKANKTLYIRKKPAKR